MKADRELSLQQQIDYVRRFGESWPLTHVAAASALMTAVGLYGFVSSNHEPLKVLSLFIVGVCGLLTFAILHHLPQLKRAARATRAGRRVQCILHLTVDRSDSENVVLEGSVREGSATWKLYFGRPLGWAPQSGEWPCHLVMLANEPIPALVELNQGLLFPTRKSHKVFSERDRLRN